MRFLVRRGDGARHRCGASTQCEGVSVVVSDGGKRLTRWGGPFSLVVPECGSVWLCWGSSGEVLVRVAGVLVVWGVWLSCEVRQEGGARRGLEGLCSCCP